LIYLEIMQQISPIVCTSRWHIVQVTHRFGRLTKQQPKSWARKY
jgi:hypothetical protein